MPSKGSLWIIAGIAFALLWASASTATKIGLTVAQPLVIAVVRFAVAAFMMLAFAHLLKGYRLPSGREWKAIAIYGLLNITIYLGFYVVAMQEVTAGIGALGTATNPVFISLMSVIFLNKRLSWSVIVALFVCTAGVICAAWPFLGQTEVTMKGLLILLFSMLSYSSGAIYFSSLKWNDLSIITINGWQTLLGGIFLLPFTLFYYQGSQNHYDHLFWIPVLWLAIPVSIFAAQLWLWLLKANAIKAGLWLFLCPIFGFAIAAWLVKDEISIYTFGGVLLVICGLLVARKPQKRLPETV
ncbi:MAG: DMT family transporter [Sphingobacteriaceae bacterium]